MIMACARGIRWSALMQISAPFNKQARGSCGHSRVLHNKLTMLSLQCRLAAGIPNVTQAHTAHLQSA